MPENNVIAIDFDSLVSEAERMIDRRNSEALQIAAILKTEAFATGKPRHYAQANYIMAFYNCLVANDYDNAILLCEEVLSKVNVQDITEIGYKIYMTLGNAYQLKGEVFSAQLWYMKGLRELEAKKEPSIKERGFLASFYYNLSLVFNETELKISAEEYLEKAIALHEELGSAFSFKLSKNYGAYASILEERKEYPAAIELVRKALDLDLKLNDPYSIALSKANLGILHIHINETEQALNYLQEALYYFENKNLIVESASVKVKLGEVLMRLGIKTEGMNHLFEAEQMFQKLDNKRELCSVYENILRFSEENGELEQALKYYHKYVDSLKQIFDVEKTNALTRAKKEFETELKEKEANILRQKNEEIKRYVFQLERSNNELNQFAHVASHDLREPLRMITSYITLLQKSLHDNLSAQQTEFVGFIYDSAKRMERLISDLLRLAKADANPRVEDVKLKSVIEEIKLNLGVLIKEKNAVIIYSGLPDIMADRTMILQLFQNIISNGMKYNESEKPAIVIKHFINHTGCEISISDNGIGIPEHQRQKAFQIFSRLHTAKEYPGSGIGLAICKKIVESMEGKIFIEDNPSGGTVFRIALPATIMARQ